MGTAVKLMNWRDHIEFRPEVLTGMPVVKGTRIAVELVLQLLAADCATDEILANYPGLTSEDVRACVAYAADLVGSERVYPLAG